MKRRLCIAVLAVCMAATAMGCGKSGDAQKDAKTEGSEKAETNGAGAKIIDADASKYVTLGDYKGMELTKTVQDVTDEQIQTQIDSDLKTKAKALGADEPAQMGDILNIDYVGKIDGEAFDGGSTDGQGTDLELGSGSYIEGFEEQLVDAKTGETRDINVTFPEDYGSEDLAGKDAVFTVTVNSIKRPGELSDDWVAENTDMKTVDEYKASVKSDLEKSSEESSETDLENTAWNNLVSGSEVKEYPEKLLKEETDLVKQQMETQIQASGMELKDFLDQMGMTEDDYNSQCEETAKSNLQMILVAQAVIDEEGLSLDDENGKKISKMLAENYGFDSVDAAVEQAGQERFDQNVAIQVVKEYLVDNAKVSDGEATPAADDETTEGSEEAQE